MLSRNTNVKHDRPVDQPSYHRRLVEWTHHSLSKLLHGFRPVTISSIQHPSDQISELPSRPDFSFLITSGAMYMGVPARLLTTPGASVPGALVRLMTFVRAIVLFPFAMTLAAPKSTNLICELGPSRISSSQLLSLNTFRG